MADLEAAVAAPVAEVLESARYFMEAVAGVSSSEFLSNLQCDRSRFTRKWRSMRGHLSAASMLSSRGSDLLINAAADVASTAFSEAKTKPVAVNSALGGLAVKDSAGSAEPQKNKEDKGSFKDVLHFANEQTRLICLGLVEEYQDIAFMHNFGNTNINVQGFAKK